MFCKGYWLLGAILGCPLIVMSNIGKCERSMVNDKPFWRQILVGQRNIYGGDVQGKKRLTLRSVSTLVACRRIWMLLMSFTHDLGGY